MARMALALRRNDEIRNSRGCCSWAARQEPTKRGLLIGEQEKTRATVGRRGSHPDLPDL
jgi:hypothetical protein